MANAFAMDFVVFSQSPWPSELQMLGYRRASSLELVVGREIVSLHLPCSRNWALSGSENWG